MKKSLRDYVASEVARLLRETRLRQGLSLNRLSEQAGLSRMMVTYVEREERNPTLDTLLRITDALGLHLDEVLAEARRAALKKSKGDPAPVRP